MKPGEGLVVGGKDGETAIAIFQGGDEVSGLHGFEETGEVTGLFQNLNQIQLGDADHAINGVDDTILSQKVGLDDTRQVLGCTHIGAVGHDIQCLIALAKLQGAAVGGGVVVLEFRVVGGQAHLGNDVCQKHGFELLGASQNFVEDALGNTGEGGIGGGEDSHFITEILKGFPKSGFANDTSEGLVYGT